MSARGLVAIGLALLASGYLVIHFGRLVLEDLLNDHDAAQGPAYDARTVEWLKELHQPNSEFDEWCEQAIALTRDLADVDLTLWEHELADGAR